MMSLKYCALSATVVFAFCALARAESELPESAESDPQTELADVGAAPDGSSLLDSFPANRRLIGELDWHTDYTSAYRQAQTEGKMLLVLFRDEEHSRIADIYEKDVLASPELRESLSGVVRVAIPLTAPRPFRIPELPGLPLISHSSFKFMYGRQGIAVLDLVSRDSEHYGQVVSAHPFSAGRHYTTRSTKIVLGLPQGTVTQRALIYAVRLHPAAPISTTDGKCHGYLCKKARESSHLMAMYGSVGHHDWGTRSGDIAFNTGRSAQEVAAMSGNQSLIEAAQEVVNQWYGSPTHWGIMSAPAAIFGYDLVRDSAGNWWGTGLFAN